MISSFQSHCPFMSSDVLLSVVPEFLLRSNRAARVLLLPQAFSSAVDKARQRACQSNGASFRYHGTR
jgi:hypothetical protein